MILIVNSDWQTYSISSYNFAYLLCIQGYLLRKYDWGVMTGGLFVPSQEIGSKRYV